MRLLHQVDEPRLLGVIDWSDTVYNRPTCRDGTLVADLDPFILDALCPQL